MLRIFWSSDDSYIDYEMPRRLVTLCLSGSVSAMRRHYWQFLDHPGRCGFLYHERAKCYTRTVNSWLLFLEATPDPEGPDSLYHEECRKIVLANWSRILSECVQGDKDVIRRLRDFTLDKACKKDVERVIAWLGVSLVAYSLLVILICVCCRWAQIYQKMSSFAGKLMALNGIHCVVGYGTGCCGRATDGGDGGRCG